MTDTVRTTLSPACRSKLVSAALAALFALASSAHAQGLSLTGNSLEIETAQGVGTALVPSELWLGGFLSGGAEKPGRIEVFSADSKLVFEVLGGLDLVRARLYLDILAPNYYAAVRLNGVDAAIAAGGGGSGADGDLMLLSSTDSETLHLDGETGTASNTLSGNGFVKGWAQIDADGDVLSCYNCDSDEMKTLKLGPGTYAVDFSPISSDVSSRPALATVNGTTQTTISTSADAGDPSRVQIFTSADAAFTIMIF